MRRSVMCNNYLECNVGVVVRQEQANHVGVLLLKVDEYIRIMNKNGRVQVDRMRNLLAC